jgi:hypothetical protein
LSPSNENVNGEEPGDICDPSDMGEANHANNDVALTTQVDINGDANTNTNADGETTTNGNNEQRSSTANRSRSRSHDGRRRGGRRTSRSPRRHRDRSRDNRRRADHGSGRGGGGGAGRQPANKYRWDRTVYVNNIPYETKWPELKDLFRDRVGGEVFFCEVFEKSDGRSAGCGAVEFRSNSDAERAVKIMHHYEFNGRKISVRIDNDGSRIKAARELAHTGGGGGRNSYDDSSNRGGRLSGGRDRDRDQSLSHSQNNSTNNAAALAIAALSQMKASSSTSNLLAAVLGLSNPLVGMVRIQIACKSNPECS